MKKIICTLATLLGLAASAQAASYSSPPVYGGVVLGPGWIVACRVFNAGPVAVSIIARQIYTNTNVLVPSASDTCNVPLGPQQYCAFHAPLGGNFAMTCHTVVTGSTANLRGVAEVQNPSHVVMNTLPMK
jgi:hypothetical protein